MKPEYFTKSAAPDVLPTNCWKMPLDDLVKAVDALYDLVLESESGVENETALSGIRSLADEIRASDKLPAIGRQYVSSILSWARILYSRDLHQQGELKTKGGADHVRFELLLDIERLRAAINRAR